jgi:hypothetical protein
MDVTKLVFGVPRMVTSLHQRNGFGKVDGVTRKQRFCDFVIRREIFLEVFLFFFCGQIDNRARLDLSRLLHLNLSLFQKFTSRPDEPLLNGSSSRLLSSLVEGDQLGFMSSCQFPQRHSFLSCDGILIFQIINEGNHLTPKLC